MAALLMEVSWVAQMMPAVSLRSHSIPADVPQADSLPFAGATATSLYVGVCGHAANGVSRRPCKRAAAPNKHG